MKNPESLSEQGKQALWNRHCRAVGQEIFSLSDYASAAELAEKARFLRGNGLLKLKTALAAPSSLAPSEPMEQRLHSLFAD